MPVFPVKKSSSPNHKDFSDLDSRSQIHASKIIHYSKILHYLVRFVTEETVALLFKIAPEQIERIECWHYLGYIRDVGVSCFVSYADFTPILAVYVPTNPDFARWQKRGQNQFAPKFWQEFYTYQFQYALSVPELFAWGKLGKT